MCVRVCVCVCVCVCVSVCLCVLGETEQSQTHEEAFTYMRGKDSHRMCVRTQITWTWLCTRGKKRYKYCSFSHTNRSFRVLGHQCVVTMGNCLI